MNDVRLREVPERIVLVERRSLVAGDVPVFLAVAFAAQRDLLGGAAPAGAPFLVIVRPMTDDVPGVAEACTPVPHQVAGRQDLRLRIEPAHREAVTTVTKREAAYPAVLQAHALVEMWVPDAGLAVAGPPREYHFADLDAAADDDPVADVALPVA